MKSAQKQPCKMVVLNADVVGYSKLVSGDLESVTAAMVRVRQIVDAKISESSGKLIDFIGDNFMAVFEDGRSAVQSALTIAAEIEIENSKIPGPRQIRFRMGIDVGDVTYAGGRYVGEPLNIASRIQEIAQPGGLCISGLFYRELDEPALRFRPIGRQRLRNIIREVDIYEFADLPDKRAVHTGCAISSDATIRIRPFGIYQLDWGRK
jgi:adenylate cyclase